MSPVLIANLILCVHLTYIGVVVFSVPLIIAGGIRRWEWVHRPVFRFTHLLMIAFVAFESTIGMECPLTVWENDYRLDAAEDVYANNNFIASWAHRLIYYELPDWMFMALYASFALLVAGLFYFVPVRRRVAHS